MQASAWWTGEGSVSWVECGVVVVVGGEGRGDSCPRQGGVAEGATHDMAHATPVAGMEQSGHCCLPSLAYSWALRSRAAWHSA